MIGLQELIHLRTECPCILCFLSQYGFVLCATTKTNVGRDIATVAILLYSPKSFSIIYLGIHWFSDIIGGMVVAVLAVHLSEKSQFVWNYLDERTINSRISALLSNLTRVCNHKK